MTKLSRTRTRDPRTLIIASQPQTKRGMFRRGNLNHLYLLFTVACYYYRSMLLLLVTTIVHLSEAVSNDRFFYSCQVDAV
jgi:hypothetical protein